MRQGVEGDNSQRIEQLISGIAAVNSKPELRAYLINHSSEIKSYGNVVFERFSDAIKRKIDQFSGGASTSERPKKSISEKKEILRDAGVMMEKIYREYRDSYKEKEKELAEKQDELQLAESSREERKIQSEIRALEGELENILSSIEISLVEDARWSDPKGYKEYFDSIYNAERVAEELDRDPNNQAKQIEFQRRVRMARDLERMAGGTRVITTRRLLTDLERRSTAIDQRNFSPTATAIFNEEIEKWYEGMIETVDVDEFRANPAYSDYSRVGDETTTELGVHQISVIPNWVNDSRRKQKGIVRNVSESLYVVDEVDREARKLIKNWAESSSLGVDAKNIEEFKNRTVAKFNSAILTIYDGLNDSSINYPLIEDAVRNYIYGVENRIKLVTGEGLYLTDEIQNLLIDWSGTQHTSDNAYLIVEAQKIAEKALVNLKVLKNYPNDELKARLSDIKTSVERTISDLDFNQGLIKDPLLSEKFIYLDVIINQINQVLEAKDTGDGKDGGIKHPDDDAEKPWRTYIETMLDQPGTKSLDVLINGVRELIDERLNLREESQKYGRRQEYFAYNGVLSSINVEKLSGGDLDRQRKLEWLKRKSAEMEKIRTITDVAHLYGNSNSMSSSWEGFVEHEGSNGLDMDYYDYYITPKGREYRKGKESYEYAEIVSSILDQYLEWLRFGPGAKWDDGKEWKNRARALWDYIMGEEETDLENKYNIKFTNADKTYFKKIVKRAPGIDALRGVDGELAKKEINGLVYNIAYGLGIRQLAFVDQHAAGATPGGVLGKNSGVLKVCYPIAADRYSTYKGKKWRMLRLFDVPRGWLNRWEVDSSDNDNSWRKDGFRERWSNIDESMEMSQKLARRFSILRDYINPGGRYDEKGPDGQRFDGPNIAHSYQTLYEHVIVGSKDRQITRMVTGEKGKTKDFTFANFMEGYNAFNEFKEAVLSVPAELDPTSVMDMNPDELVEKLLNYMETTLLQTLVSNLKKNAYSINFDHVAWMLLDWTDRAQALLGLCKKSKTKHARRLLHGMRYIFQYNAANLAGLGHRVTVYDEEGNKTGEKLDVIYRPQGDPDREKLAFDEVVLKKQVRNSKGKIRYEKRTEARVDSEPGWTEKDKREAELDAYDIRDFLLNMTGRLEMYVEAFYYPGVLGYFKGARCGGDSEERGKAVLRAQTHDHVVENFARKGYLRIRDGLKDTYSKKYWDLVYGKKKSEQRAKEEDAKR